MTPTSRPTMIPTMPSIHDFTVESITGDPVALSSYAGKLCLVVNLASR